MKRLDEGYERGAAASRQREAIHGGVMKDEKQRGEHEWSVLLLSERGKMKDFEEKKRRVGVYKSWRVRGELYSDDSMGRPVAPKRHGK
jgi:hypothetical protein